MHTVLRTDRLTLRPMTTRDLETTFAYAGSPGNTQFMMFLPYASSDEAAAELSRMEEKMNRLPCRDYFFAIEYNGRHIGEISLELDAAMTAAELGWILHRDFWGKGIMTEAAIAVRDFARTLSGLRLLYAHCDSKNKGSSKVMEHIGMSLAATGARRNRNSTELSAEYCYTLILADC